MPKHDFLTPKAISNRIKAKGLQKLRWYCQMCEKQCRDENGFKCHLTSESHQRQLLLVADNPHKFTDHFSKEFLSNFLSVLRRQYGTRRVLANTVYQSYISDRNHLHMNSTRWVTLGGLCQWLGRQGMCKVDETSRGWYIAYIDRDPETIARQEKLKKKDKLELDDDEKVAKFVEKQVARGATSLPSTDSCYTELKREDEDELIQIRLETKTTSLPSTTSVTSSNPLLALTEDKESVKLKRPSKSDVSGAKKGRQSALEEIRSMEERRRERENRTDHWLRTEIVVKVQASKLGEKYFAKKGVVVGIEDKFVALVKMIDSGDVLRMDQLYLETVIPNIGREVLVVNGAYRGSKGRIVRVHPDSFSVDIEVLDGVRAGIEVKGVEYEDVCKLHKSK